MKATAVSKVLIDKANDKVILGLTGEDGDIEITVPLARIPTLAASLIYDGELAVHVDSDTAALALVCLNRVREVHAHLWPCPDRPWPHTVWPGLPEENHNMAKIDNDRLLGLPNVGYCDDGYDWMGKLSDDRKVIPNRQGEEMGDWPYVIVAAYDDPQADVYGFARYVEGYVILGTYDSHSERDIALENHHLWQMGRKNS